MVSAVEFEVFISQEELKKYNGLNLKKKLHFGKFIFKENDTPSTLSIYLFVIIICYCLYIDVHMAHVLIIVQHLFL